MKEKICLYEWFHTIYEGALEMTVVERVESAVFCTIAHAES